MNFGPQTPMLTKVLRVAVSVVYDIARRCSWLTHLTTGYAGRAADLASIQTRVFWEAARVAAGLGPFPLLVFIAGIAN